MAGIRAHRPDGPERRASRTLLLIPLALMAAIAVADILSPPDIHLGPLLVVAPAITASFAGPRTTAAIGAAAVAVLVLIGIARKVITTENLVVQIASLIAISALVVLFDRLREKSQYELARVRTVSEAAQRVLLRPLPERIGPLRIASSYRAAESDAQVGGDLFAAARTADSTRLIIGDVRGKGLAALGDTAMLLGAFRAAAHRQAALPVLAAYLEGSVSWGLAERAPVEPDGPDGRRVTDDQHDPHGLEIGEGFVTALIIDIPDDRPTITMVNCGHPPPLLLHRGRAVTLDVRDPAPPLGLGGLSDTRYTPTSFPFRPGDLLLLYTDGVSEARDPTGDFYPLPARLERPSERDPARLLAWLNADLDSHVTGPLDDDAAMVAVTADRTG